jgi:hypothetical protein
MVTGHAARVKKVDRASIVQDLRFSADRRMVKRMTTIQEIETAIRNLSESERAAFRAWYAEFDAQEWDRQLEADASAGRLNWLVDEARADFREGRCTDR